MTCHFKKQELKIKLYILIIIIEISVIVSCNSISPAGFWNSFYSEKIDSKNSDQGPWGGHRNFVWTSKSEKYFDSKSIIDYAANNGWTFIDSVYISTDTLKPYTASESLNNEYWEDILRIDVLPKWKGQKVKILKFKTGLVAIEPGNTKETEINGFATTNLSGTELHVDHKWGE